MQRTEHQEQAVVHQYLELNKIPHYAIPNANILSAFNRTAASRVGAKMKREGVSRGVPDLHIPVLREIDGKYYGSLYIEMKKDEFRNKKGGGLSGYQKDWITKLNSDICSQYAITCYSADEAINAINNYLNGKKPEEVKDVKRYSK